MTKSKKFYMAGTFGSGQYVVIAATARGRIGIRPLGCALDKVSKITEARVRVEPSESPKILAGIAKILDEKGWKQPGQGDQHRFSTVVRGGGKKLKGNVEKALVALGAGKLKTEVNPEAPAWAKDLVASLAA